MPGQTVVIIDSPEFSHKKSKELKRLGTDFCPEVSANSWWPRT